MHPASPSARLRGADHLDDADVQLIELLTEDGRMSVRQLSQQVGLTETTVTARLRSLTGRNIMRVRAVVDWRVAGFIGGVDVLIKVDNTALDDVVKDLTVAPQVQSISRVFGSIDLIARVLISDLNNAAASARRTVDAIPGAEIGAILIEVETLKYLTAFHNVDVEGPRMPALPRPPISLDALDTTIINALADDARQSWRRIAESLGASESTVRARARRIEDSGLVKVMAQIDPHRAGLSIGTAWIGITADGTGLPTLLDQVCAMSELSVVVHTIGKFDILVFAAVPDFSQLANLIDTLRRLDGVVATETWIVSVMKQPAFPWGVFPDQKATA